MLKKISSSRWLFELCSVNLDTDEYHSLVGKTAILRFATWQLECTEKVYVKGYMELFRTHALSRMCYLYPGFTFESAVGVCQKDILSNLAAAEDIVQGPWTIGVRAHSERITKSVVIKEVPVVQEILVKESTVEELVQPFKWTIPIEEASTEEDVVDEGSVKDVRCVPLIAADFKSPVNAVMHTGCNYLYDMAEVDKCYLDALKFSHC